MKPRNFSFHSFLLVLVCCFAIFSCRSVVPGRLEEPGYQANDLVLDYPGFSLLYDPVHKQPRWVAYELTAEEASIRLAPRTDHFYADPRITSATATNNDYLHSGFDRGHLAPAADMAFSEESMNASFCFSNISPQNPSFNRGIWASIEALVRVWAIELGSVYVVTGPVLPLGNKRDETSAPLTIIGNNQVTVPAYFYKAVLFISDTETMAIAFLLPNAGSKNSPEYFTVSIDHLETSTGLDFFPALPDTIENRIEASFSFFAWPTEAHQ